MSALLGVVAALTPNNVISGFTFAATIDSALASYNVATAATAAGWNGTAIVTATITQETGGEITQGDESTNAFDTGTLPAGSTVALTLESGAFTRGAGGAGGNGGILNRDGKTGITGGTAINFQSNGSITVDSGATVSGGGGGGGGGGGFFDDPAEGYGGGGGGGFPNGAGGSGLFTASDGSAGTTGGGGAGGSGASSGGNGGAGGAVATAGTAGSAATGSGGAAGGAGSAIEKNGNTVTVTNNGQVDGDING